jgi:kynurenine 3-monooxygenase
LIGLGGRGQFALKSFGVWDDVEKRCVAVRGRKDWPPDSKEGVERVFSNKEKLVTTQVLPRDKLVGVLHQHILEHFVDQIELNYGYELQPLDFGYADGSQVLLQVSKCTEEVVRMNPSAVMTATEETVDVVCDTDSSFQIATDLLIAADGTVRTVANAMAKEDKKRFAAMNPVQRLFAGKPFYVKRYVDDNQRIYKTVPLKSPKEWRPDLNYSARTKDGRVNFDALPATTKGEYCGVLLLKKDDPLAKADTNPAELRSLMDDALPQFSALLDDETIASVAKKPVSYLPGFRYAGPRLHQGNRCVILGDCAHTVKPYFGLGANSALEDVQILSDVLDENKHDYTAAVHSYSRQQAGEAKALVRISRELDRPGMVGFITFILPIILDSIFNKQFPKLFQPNVITMLQREAYTFQQVARRKRFDRLGQVGIIGGFMFGACWATQKSIRLVASLFGKSTSFVSFALVLGIGSVTFLRSFAAKYLVAGLAPADVITRMKKE